MNGQNEKKKRVGRTYTKLKLRSPESFAFNSSSTFRSSPMLSLAGFFSPFLPDLDDDGIGGRPPPFPKPPLLLFAFSTTLARALFCLLLRRRRRLRPLLVVPAPLLAVVSASEWPEMEVVSLMRRPDMSMWRGFFPFEEVFVTGTGPPGPPRRRRGPEVVLPGREEDEEGLEEDLLLGLAAVSGEEAIVGRDVRVVVRRGRCRSGGGSQPRSRGADPGRTSSKGEKKKFVLLLPVRS